MLAVFFAKVSFLEKTTGTKQNYNCMRVATCLEDCYAKLKEEFISDFDASEDSIQFTSYLSMDIVQVLTKFKDILNSANYTKTILPPDYTKNELLLDCDKLLKSLE